MNTSNCEKFIVSPRSRSAILAERLMKSSPRGPVPCGTGALLLIATLASLPATNAIGEAPYSTAWIRQLGSSNTEWGRSVALDSAGNIFLAGQTAGSLGGPNAGLDDAYLAKYSNAGVLLWVRQIGTSASDWGSAVGVDSAGNAYLTGHTYGNIGAPPSGAADVFIAKYSPAGALLWTRQIGTSAGDYPNDIAVDAAGNAFIVGDTSGSLAGPNAGSVDAFVVKYSPAGALLWSRQFGTSSYEIGWSVALTSAGDAVICGATGGNLGGPSAGFDDAFIVKYSAAGSPLWSRQFGTPDSELASAITLDSAGDIFITGYTDGDLDGPNAGWDDAFIAKWSASGSFLWARQIGSNHIDAAFAVATDSTGSAFICGSTLANLGGPNAGAADVFISKFSGSGAWLWTRQFGTTSGDQALALVVDSSDTVIMGGRTTGSLGGPHTGTGDDAFIAKFAPSTCTADLSANGAVDIDDLLSVINNWGWTGAAGGNLADIAPPNGNGAVDIDDLLVIVNAWGRCP